MRIKIFQSKYMEILEEKLNLYLEDQDKADIRFIADVTDDEGTVFYAIIIIE